MIYIHIISNFILVFLVRTSDQVRCLTHVNYFQIQLNDTNLDEQIQNVTSRLINRTQQTSFCSFNLLLLHTTRQVIVRYSCPHKVEADQIVVKTVVELVQNTSLVTTVQGKCTTDICDLGYTISTVRWMLSKGQSYSNVRKILQDLLHKETVSRYIFCFQWYNNNQLKDCQSFTCLNRKLPDVHSAQCLVTTRPPYVELEMFAKINKRSVTTEYTLIYLCRADYCNSKGTDSKIAFFMWQRFDMNRLFEPIKLTNSPDNETTVKTTTMKRPTMMRRTTTKKKTTTTTYSTASTKLCTSLILPFLLLINTIFSEYCS